MGQEMAISNRIFLQNDSLGSRFQPLGFLIDPNDPSTFVDQVRTSGEHRASGFGSFVWAANHGIPKKVFVGVYVSRGIWKCRVGTRIYDLDSLHCSWRKVGISLGGLGLAELKILANGTEDRLFYFRPWLRHWFEGMWSQGDIDIGATLSGLANDKNARLQVQEKFAGGFNL